MNDIVYVAKVMNGSCTIFDARTRAIQRTINESGQIVGAMVNGNIVSLTLRNNKIVIYDCSNGARLGSV